MVGVKENNMAERLTEKIFDNNGKQQDIYEWSSASSLECNRKLGELEDILEKYNIDSVEELDSLIANYKISSISTEDRIKEIAVNEQIKIMQSMVKEIVEKECNQLYTECNTWKRACELACKWFKQTGFIGDQTEVNYYYQQAKKEGNDE